MKDRIKNYMYFLQLFKVMWRNNPFITSLWVISPLLVSITIIPILNSQRDVINIIASNMNAPIKQLLSDAIIPFVLFLVASMGQELFTSFRNIASLKMSNTATRQLQSDIINNAQRVDYEHFESKDYYDKLTRAKLAVGNDIVGILGDSLTSLQIIFNFIALLVVIQQGHWLLSLIVSLSFFIAFIVRIRVEIAVKKLNRDMTTDGRMADYLKNTIWTPHSIRELKLYNSLTYMINKWGSKINNQNALRFNERRKEIKAGGILSVIQTTAVIIALYLMVKNAANGVISIGEVVVVFMAMLTANGLAGQLSWPMSRLYIQAYKISELVEFLNMDITKDNQPLISKQKLKSIHDIKFEHVNFTYPSGENVLKDINLSIKPGEVVALVGENSAGKSTLVKLILGLYKPTSGRVLINGVDLNKIDMESYHDKISAVFQDFVKYELSIRENVAFGNIKEHSDDKSILQTLKKFEVDDLLNESKDLNQILGRLNSGGKELSGGQWQKLAMCRAFYKESDLIILDEPTASIDPSAEFELFKQFMSLSEGTTSVFVSHRLGWARHSDRIIVLHKGEVVESGNHQDLMEKKEMYFDMFTLQSSWYSQMSS